MVDEATKQSVVLTYGNGTLMTGHGHIDGTRCLYIQQSMIARPIGSCEPDVPGVVPLSDIAVTLKFLSLESARVLQDELNEMVSAWSRQQGQEMYAVSLGANGEGVI